MCSFHIIWYSLWGWIRRPRTITYLLRLLFDVDVRALVFTLMTNLGSGPGFAKICCKWTKSNNFWRPFGDQINCPGLQYWHFNVCWTFGIHRESNFWSLVCGAVHTPFYKHLQHGFHLQFETTSGAKPNPIWYYLIYCVIHLPHW